MPPDISSSGGTSGVPPGLSPSAGGASRTTIPGRAEGPAGQAVARAATTIRRGIPPPQPRAVNSPPHLPGRSAASHGLGEAPVSKNGPVDLPVMPPVPPMLAKAVPSIPDGLFYEPKWDGFRSIIFRDGDEVEIGSRNERPMTRYFPEVVEALKANLPEGGGLDGGIVIPDGEGARLDFEALLQRIHPAASRVNLL